MTAQEAGWRGGSKTAEPHGRDFYERMGKKGGEVLSARYGRKHSEAMGRKGGGRMSELVAKAKALEVGGDA